MDIAPQIPVEILYFIRPSRAPILCLVVLPRLSKRISRQYPLLDGGIDDLSVRVAVHRDAGQLVPGPAYIVAYHRILDVQRAGMVVGDKEDRGAIAVNFVVLDKCSVQASVMVLPSL